MTLPSPGPPAVCVPCCCPGSVWDATLLTSIPCSKPLTVPHRLQDEVRAPVSAVHPCRSGPQLPGPPNCPELPEGLLLSHLSLCQCSCVTKNLTGLRPWFQEGDQILGISPVTEVSVIQEPLGSFMQMRGSGWRWSPERPRGYVIRGLGLWARPTSGEKREPGDEVQSREQCGSSSGWS